jgi:hypothetical protein
VSAPDPRKDSRFRRFRAASYGIYVTVVTVFCLWLSWNVARSVAAMTPERPPSVTPPLSFRECLDSAQSLWADLEGEREKLVRVSPARMMDREWMRYRTDWLARVRQEESRCALESRDPSRQQLRTLFHSLEHVQDLYTIHAVQYAGEVGGAVDALHAAFDAARSNAAAGRLP